MLTMGIGARLLTGSLRRHDLSEHHGIVKPRSERRCIVWRVLVGLFVMVLFATCQAQRTPILVYVQSQYSDEFNSAVVNALTARLAATTRYAVTEDLTAKTLPVGINCAELSAITHLTYPSHNSGVCA